MVCGVSRGQLGRGSKLCCPYLLSVSNKAFAIGLARGSHTARCGTMSSFASVDNPRFRIDCDVGCAALYGYPPSRFLPTPQHACNPCARL
eukprot:364362-Chlamydomonas_euryale.AAC.19